MALSFSAYFRAIVWAQWRSVWNYFPRTSKTGLALSVFLGVLWYGGFAALSVGTAIVLADTTEAEQTGRLLPGLLLGALIYFQAIPILLVSAGLALDLKKLQIYPIPRGHLFGIDVLLRSSTSVEILMLLTGATVGSALNPHRPVWTASAFVLFAVFNLLLSVGLRDLLAQLMARRVVREVVILVFVLAAGIPQLLTSWAPSPTLRTFGSLIGSFPWPWLATSRVVNNSKPVQYATILLVWVAAAYLFSSWQFHKTLSFDAQESSSDPGRQQDRPTLLDRLFSLPGGLLPDPIGALLDKEIRSLARSPRFRLVFLMGFSFGLLIWLPVTFGRSASPDSWMAHHYLTVLAAYAILLLSDALFWNVFGLDRSATQFYFSVPVSLKVVLLAKNLAAIFYVLLELTLIVLVCWSLQLPVAPVPVVEAYAASITICLILVSVGNLSSVHRPKPVDPKKSLRSGGGRSQASLALLFPVSTFPIVLAYGAAYGFGSPLAYFGVLFLFCLFGLAFYRIASDSAVSTAALRTEEFLSKLSGGAGPVSS